MPSNTLLFSTLTNASPYTPPPTGYTQPPTGFATQARINGGQFSLNNDTYEQGLWYDNTVLSGNDRRSSVVLGTVSFASGYSSGPGLFNTSGDGIVILAGSTGSNFRIFKYVGWTVSGSVLATNAQVPISGDSVEVRFDGATNTFTGWVNGTQLSSFSVVDATINPTRAGCSSRRMGSTLASLTSKYALAHSTTATFSGGAQNPLTDIPAGWTSYGSWLRVSAGGGSINGNAFGQMVFSTYSGGLRTLTAAMAHRSATWDAEWGFCFINTSRTGFSLIIKNSSTTLRKEIAGAGGATIATTAATNSADATFSIDFDDSTGAITVKKAGSTVLTGTYTDTPTLLAGIQSYKGTTPQTFSSVTLDYTEAQTITSINGGSPITASQTGIAIVASGFTAKPTAVTATYASGAKSITATVDSGGTATNFNISIQDRIEAEDWPVNGDTLTFTFTYLSESATGTQTLVKKADEVVLTVSGGITSDPATWTYWLNDDGFTVEGGEHVYDPYGDLVLTADGGGSATNAGTFTSWFRPSTGTGAGNVYAYTWVITEAGISPAGSGLTSSGLTSSGLTIAGLTSSGL